MVSERSGFELPLLLAGAFRVLIDELHAELAERGHPHVRPLHGFALQAIGPDGTTVTELGRRLGVTKQAATKTAERLEALGYVERRRSPDDGRVVLVARTDRGVEMLETSAEVFEVLRADLCGRLGDDRVAALEDDLAHIVADVGGVKLGDLPGWLR
ncbi:MAG: MarR family transcriptional regulator [Actinomycetota bacterium]|nr:MarR family transcriptional regulator [Actinomycetota bacterium]